MAGGFCMLDGYVDGSAALEGHPSQWPGIHTLISTLL